MKYKEIPISDELGPSQFEVGDRVRVWWCGEATEAKVLKPVYDSTGERMQVSMNGTTATPFWKQCRKLVPVEPREIWWCVECERDTKSRDTKSPDELPLCEYRNAHEVIKLREVLDE